MQINTKNLNHTFIFIFLVCMFFVPYITNASSPLWYENIIRINADNAIIRVRGLENKQYFSCSISTLLCSDLSDLPPSEASSSSPAPKTTVKFPANSTFQKISSTGRFGFYTNTNTAMKTRTIGVVDGQNKKQYSITSNLNFWNLIELQPRVSRFAPDDSTLAYIDDRSGSMSLYVVSLASLSQKSLSVNKITTDSSVGDFMYADSNTLLYVANSKVDPYNWVLYSYDITKKTKKVLAQNLAYDSLLYKSDDSIIFTQLTPLGTRPVVFTNYINGELKTFKTSVQTPVNTNTITYSYKKIAGINTVLMQNSNPTKSSHPLIIWLHGGPYRQSSFQRHTYISYGVYDWVLEEAVNSGDAYVLKIDYPGSYGSGRAFTENIKSGVGTKDVSAVMNVIKEFTKNNKNTDGVYVVGNSYGGYMVGKMMTLFPGISGGLSINGVTDWKSLLLYYKNSIFNTFFGGLPSTKNKTLFANASIINNISKMKNPLYIVQGEVDSTIPKSQAILLKNALDKAKKNSTLIIIPNENHVFLKDDSINIICKTLFEMTDLDATNSCNLQG
jgi:dipeptidyl aminopeptidase/acylaminoacyl peptidase